MSTVTISKTEYKALVNFKVAVERDFMASPPVRSVKKIIEAFKATGLYNKKFLASLESGLRRSSYFRP